MTPGTLLTKNQLADELGIHPFQLSRVFRKHRITPDYLAGRTFLFRPSRLPKIRAAIGAPSPLAE